MIVAELRERWASLTDNEQCALVQEIIGTYKGSAQAMLQRFGRPAMLGIDWGDPRFQEHRHLLTISLRHERGGHTFVGFEQITIAGNDLELLALEGIWIARTVERASEAAAAVGGVYEVH